MAAACLFTPNPIHMPSSRNGFVNLASSPSAKCRRLLFPNRLRFNRRIYCNQDDNNRTGNQPQSSSSSIQLYGEIERLLTETVRQSQGAWGGSSDWSEIEKEEFIVKKTVNYLKIRLSLERDYPSISYIIGNIDLLISQVHLTYILNPPHDPEKYETNEKGDNLAFVEHSKSSKQ
ncbi:hypothetical protein SLEP1_g43397 [Rubroshorea leprosula]|uniref:Uncharacterized protein n=1 Tax=Rubroshorea leprosula TaxID=152421 RepID=A0AAV5LD89_9ROSI|nr:hypothetical protein SLEP1_g43397 [Rubroshorea leprosula]